MSEINREPIQAVLRYLLGVLAGIGLGSMLSSPGLTIIAVLLWAGMQLLWISYWGFDSWWGND